MKNDLPVSEVNALQILEAVRDKRGVLREERHPNSVTAPPVNRGSMPTRGSVEVPSASSTARTTIVPAPTSP